MIYLILILFFSSLIGITFMVGRKLILIKSGKAFAQTEASFEVPYLREVKNLTIESIKKYEHASLVLIVKLYIRSANSIKNKYAEFKENLKNVNKKSKITGERHEVSKFLKMISDYQHRVKEIKHKIKEEENNS